LGDAASSPKETPKTTYACPIGLLTSSLTRSLTVAPVDRLAVIARQVRADGDDHAGSFSRRSARRSALKALHSSTLVSE
jgi:hypothetical protein